MKLTNDNFHVKYFTNENKQNHAKILGFFLILFVLYIAVIKYHLWPNNVIFNLNLIPYENIVFVKMSFTFGVSVSGFNGAFESISVIAARITSGRKLTAPTWFVLQ